MPEERIMGRKEPGPSTRGNERVMKLEDPPAQPKRRAGLCIGLYYGSEQPDPVVVPLEGQRMLKVLNPENMPEFGYGDQTQNGIPVLYYVTEKTGEACCWLVGINHVEFKANCAPLTDKTEFVREWLVPGH